MDEEEWLRCDDPTAMLEFLQASLSDPLDSVFDDDESGSGRPRALLNWKAVHRKLRLFACACVRGTGEFGGTDSLHAIGMSEQYADGLIDKAALEAAFVPVRKLPEPIPLDADMALSSFGPTDMAHETRLIDLLVSLGPDLDVRALATEAANILTQRKGAAYLSERGRSEASRQAHLLRDIFGNPFRLVPLDPSRLGEKTRAVARAIYEKGRFADLPKLARALKKDPGCTNRELWEHCEWPIRHARGCWVVDLVLQKN